MNLLSLCWHNKMLLPANFLKSLLSQLANSCNISWGLDIWDCGDGALTPPLSLGCIPLERQEEIPTGASRQLDLEGESSFGRVRVRASDTQRNPVRCRNQRGEGSTAHQTGKTGSNSGLPQDAEGELDHLPMGHPSNHHFWGETMSQVQGAVWKNGAV
jgi:hypothetical protein